MQIDFVFIIIVLILSVVVHEVAHGYAANMLGDPTARIAGRLTLNPIRHLDLFGSILLPGLLVLSSSPFLFGYAKPVPYNPYNLRNQKWGEAWVAAAGPLINIVIALFFAVLIRVGVAGNFLTPAFVELASVIIYINVLLAVINLLPIPPLDGSKVLSVILPLGLSMQYSNFRNIMERNIFLSFGLLILFIIVFGAPIFRFIGTISTFLAGI
ncbi:MAG: site-2 protease family protein [Candidatus Pacebacteria bacterium]|jgi:Zn-dependent protease|nr:site-2 protease family protein [bacterium]MDP6527320.1 site-2 protease family protein [Candidatus Paceibacterota bacterium]MDP6659402.1 site-2 protease family protein [Candidatus Paceibacterota bacterium]|tara:strand:- start:27923 stop:28558 length:636 start_codon:yes stop_codon:yes gene_type:complete